MDDLDKYKQTEILPGELGFEIRHLSDWNEKTFCQTNKSHRHDSYLVILILEGSGAHEIDFNTYPLNAGQIYFLQPGQVHRLTGKGALNAYPISFSSQFLVDNNIPCAL